MCLTIWAIGFCFLLLGSFNFVYLDHCNKPNICAAEINEDYLRAFFISLLWPVALILTIGAGVTFAVGKVLIFTITIPAKLYKARKSNND